MHETRMLCLAVSRRESGNCIAGIDIDSKEWIRPINSRTRAAFADADLVVREPGTSTLRFMAPLDLIAITLEEYAGTNAQPENWTVAPASHDNPYLVLQRCDSPRATKFLHAHSDLSGPLLDGPEDALLEADLAVRALSHSLALIVPRNLSWHVAANPRYPNRVQVRAWFHFDDCSCNLVVTDPVWEAKCRDLGSGAYPHSTISGQMESEVFLTISLAAIPLHGHHYKLVAGVILAPH